MSETTPRRSLVAIVAVVTLLGAAAVVRAASVWTASNATLDAKPADAQVLSQQLRDEQARSANLLNQLSALTDRADQLAQALQAAEANSAADAQTATQLAAKLKAAQAKLAGLQAQLAAAGTGSPATTGSSPASTPAPVTTDGGGGYDD